MTVVDTRSTAAELPGGWSSFVLGQVGSTELKVLRMDGRVLEAESHDAAEALMVMDGALHLMAAWHRGRSTRRGDVHRRGGSRARRAPRQSRHARHHRTQFKRALVLQP